MKIKLLIEALQALFETRGDIEVCHKNDWTEFYVTRVFFDPASDSYPPDHCEYIPRGDEFYHPDRVIIDDDGEYNVGA